jgi:hypothetical protein
LTFVKFVLHLVNQTLQVMKTRFLFPYWCKYLGAILFVVHIPIVLFKKELGFDNLGTMANSGLFNGQHLFFMTTTLLMLTGLVLFAFSKEKIEDEQISQLRLDSLQWAIYLSYILLIISLALTTGADFKDIMHLNVWIPLIIFIVLFRWKMFRNNQLLKNTQ